MPSPVRILVTSRFRDDRPDILLLQSLEQACLRSSNWKGREGPLLFPPTKISTRIYTILQTALRPLLRRRRVDCVFLSLGLPYRHYFFGKTFPFFGFDSTLRVLWTYDVWPGHVDSLLRIVREARIDLLLVSSQQGAEQLQAQMPARCAVHWVPEAIETTDFPQRPWAERTIDVLAFGRTYARYHEAVASGCEHLGIRYVHARFATTAEFKEALGNARVSICFPRALTHPDDAGSISTITLRYLESMAAGCLVLGSCPADGQAMFGYNPVVEVDWADPVGQLRKATANPSPHEALISRNSESVERNHQIKHFVQKVDQLIAERLESN